MPLQNCTRNKKHSRPILRFSETQLIRTPTWYGKAAFQRVVKVAIANPTLPFARAKGPLYFCVFVEGLVCSIVWFACGCAHVSACSEVGEGEICLFLSVSVCSNARCVREVWFFMVSSIELCICSFIRAFAFSEFLLTLMPWGGTQ